MVAKSYQGLPMIGEPYEKNKRKYIIVECKNGHRKEVRFYTEQEYAKMYPDEARPSAEIGICGGKKIRSTKEVLGFSEGYIYLVKGDTYNFKDWLSENGATYRTFWGWAFPSGNELPQLPAGLSVVQLFWEKIADVERDELKSQTIINEAVAEIIYDPSPSKWQGSIGERITRYLTVTKVTELPNGYYGPSTFYLFVDEEENEYTWTTAARKLELGETYEVVGTIKAFSKYKGKEQTVLTRCRIN